MVQKKQIKSIIFDLGGVITYGGYLDFVKHYVHPALVPYGKQKILELEHQVNLGNITETEFYREIEKVFNVHLNPAQMHKIITDKMRVNKQLIHLIPTLKKAKVAIFSNSIGNMAKEVLKEKKVPTKKLFSKLFMSNKMHLAKPNKAGYEFVLKHLKVKPHEALMVDDRTENIRAAKKLGIQGIVFRNVRQFQREMKRFELV